MVVPAAKAESVPVVVVVLIVPTPVLEEDQALLEAAVPEPVSAVVLPIQTLAVPVMLGRALTEIVPVAFTVPRPPVSGIE